MKSQLILPTAILATVVLYVQPQNVSAADSTAVDEAVAVEKAVLKARDEKRRAQQEAQAAQQDSPDSIEPAEPAPPDSTAAVPRDIAPATEPTMQLGTMTAGSVGRAAFTTMVRDREPMDDVTTLVNDVREINFFTELHDLTGQTVIHRWEYDGNVMAEVSFDVRGPRWRVWSRKSLLPDWTGTWKVSVVNGAGDVVYEALLDYLPAATDQAVP